MPKQYKKRFVPSVASQKMIIGNDIGNDAILGLKSKSLSLDSYLHHLLMNMAILDRTRKSLNLI